MQINYVSPQQLQMPSEIIDELDLEQRIYSLEDFENVLPKTDILYMTRIQKERFSSQEEYEDVMRSGKYKLTPEVLTLGKKDLVIMHPLPRIDEISVEVDNDPRAAYFRQMKNGLYLRMALLKHIL